LHSRACVIIRECSSSPTEMSRRPGLPADHEATVDRSPPGANHIGATTRQHENGDIE
jgi:hypothetical protein